MTAFVLMAIRLGTLTLIANEMDVLPVARQLVEPSWLPADWYLNLAFPYRVAFDALAGPMVLALGFHWAALLGRLLCLALYAAGVDALSSTLELSVRRGMVLGIVAAAMPSLGAFEAMSYGFDAKSVAYPFVLFALVALHRDRPRAAAAFLGVAASFHALVGSQAAFCLLVAALATPELHGRLLRAIPWGLLTGAPGIVAVARHATSGVGASAADGARIYVHRAVPFHVVVRPSWFVAAAVLIAIVVLVARSDARSRTFARVAVGMGALGAMGLCAQVMGAVHLQKLYWFRVTDAVLPVMAAGVVLRAAGRLRGRIRASRPRPRAVDAAFVVYVALSVVGFATLRWDKVPPAPYPLTPPRSDAWSWIRTHTDRSAVFLVDPTWMWFYIEAERPMFVSFKHTPQREADVVTWYERLVACGGGEQPRARGFRMGAEIAERFVALPDETLGELARRYDLTYLVAPAARPHPAFARVFADDAFAVYDLRSARPSPAAADHE